jgi:colanic acid/amylovoran biosynthesis glycosyltransferase
VTDLSVVLLSSGGPDSLLATLRSLAPQTEVSCEIVVVDMGQPDPPGLAAAMREDARVRVRRNEPALGEVAAAQRVLGEGNTALVMFARAGDVLLPGALRALHDEISDSPAVGLAHALWFPIGTGLRMSRTTTRAHVARIRARFPPDGDHRPMPGGPADAVQALPTFRREALRASGGLSGASLDDALHRAAAWMRDRAQVRLVPEVLCATPWMRHRAKQSWATRVPGLARRPLSWLRNEVERLLRVARAAPLAGTLLRAPGPHEMLGALLQRWSFDEFRRPRKRAQPAGDERIAYVLWRYPMLSETFIRREVQALGSAGVNLEVFALEPDNPLLAADPSSPAGPVMYFGPVRGKEGRASILRYLRRRPWTVIRLWLFIVRHRYRSETTWWQDRDVLYLAGQLAVALENNGITHVHAPWANPYALISFAASRLLGLTYSVQARASEIHRSVPTRIIADRLRFAEFVITNSRYNERYLRAQLGTGKAPPVHVIYNGVELHRFPPVIPAVRKDGDPFRLLAVGRLVEPKGFRYLLHACRILHDRGIDLSCEIIGGPVEPSDTVTWLELRMLHTDLDLESSVHFLGAQPFSSVLAAHERAHVFVLPCVRARDGSHDITPNSLLEAMARGLPVVSTRSGAIPEIVDHGRDGILVSPGDERAIADALEDLRNDPGLRDALGSAARKKIEERFDIDRNVAQRVRLFRSLRAEEPDEARDPAAAESVRSRTERAR